MSADQVRRAGGAYLFPGTGVLYIAADDLRGYVEFNPNAPPSTQVQHRALVASLPPVERWAGVADRNSPDVEDALFMLGQAIRSEDWRLLYFVYEIIEDQVGSRRMAMLLGESQKEITRFKQTANSRPAIGTKARHGTRKTLPPTNPMTFREAGGLLRRWLLAWIRSLSEPAVG